MSGSESEDELITIGKTNHNQDPMSNPGGGLSPPMKKPTRRAMPDSSDEETLNIPTKPRRSARARAAKQQMEVDEESSESEPLNVSTNGHTNGRKKRAQGWGESSVSEVDDEMAPKIKRTKTTPPEEESSSDEALEVPKKVKTEKKKAKSKGKDASAKKEKKPAKKPKYEMPGQKKDTPGELDGARIFYESLLKQKPSSKMALDYLLRHGLLPKERAQELVDEANKKKATAKGPSRTKGGPKMLNDTTTKGGSAIKKKKSKSKKKKKVKKKKKKIVIDSGESSSDEPLQLRK